MIKKVNENYVQVICEECMGIEFECESMEEAENYEYDYGYNIEINGEIKTVYSCCEGDFTWCDGCNEYHYSYDYNFYTVGYDTYCEESGLDHGYLGICAECGDIMDIDYLCWNENYGDYYCEYCYPNDGIIADWHDHKYNDLHFNKAKEEDEPKFYFGIELEIDRSESDFGHNVETAQTIRDEYFSDNEMYFENDGSLWNGFEIITHPMSYNYIMENKNRFSDLFNYINFRGYTGEENKSAGLHFHISNENLTDEQIELIVYFIENNVSDVHKLSRRPGDLNRYACSYCFDTLDQFNKAKEIEGDLAYSEVMRLFYKKNYSRYHMVNVTNCDTIEFRFFKSTLNINHFIGSIQFINTLVSMAMSNTLRDWHTVEDIINYTDTDEIEELFDYIS